MLPCRLHYLQILKSIERHVVLASSCHAHSKLYGCVQLVELLTSGQKDGSSQLTSSSQLSQRAAQTIDVLDMRKHASTVLIEVLCLCNARLADSSGDAAVPASARRQVEGLEVEVTDDVADSLWAFAEGLLDEKCRLHALIADLEENSDPGASRSAPADEVHASQDA